MSGTDHYAAAERCISSSYEADMSDDAMFHLAEAQVHATLALAATLANAPRDSSRITIRVDGEEIL